MNQKNIIGRMGDYEILELLGTGGMGKVFKVRNVILDRVEAMKIVLPDLADRQDLAQRFLREIKLLAGLNHSNIASLRTAFTLDNQLVMIMEFVEGATLADHLKKGRIPIKEAVGYIDQALDALSYAHRRRIIHRDIKPANMMLTPDGVLKLMDFGIARVNDSPGITRTGATLGSPGYMSPEQIMGKDVDARSDLYSVTVSLYEFVTGAPPFLGDSDFSIMTAHTLDVPIPPVELQPDLPLALSEAIVTGLAKDPDHRFQSADDFRIALKNVFRQPLPKANSAFGSVASLDKDMDTDMDTDRPTIADPAFAMPTHKDDFDYSRVGKNIESESLHRSVSETGTPANRGLYVALGVFVIAAVLAAFLYGQRRTPVKPPTAPGIGAIVEEITQGHQPTEVTSPPVSPPPVSAGSDSGNAQPSGGSGPAPPQNNPPKTGTVNDGGAGAPPITVKKPISRKLSGSYVEDEVNNAGNLMPPPSGVKTNKLQNVNGNNTGAISIPPANTAEITAEIRDLERQLTDLSSRAAALSGIIDARRKDLLENMGAGLRSDLTAAENRMKSNIGRAEQALQSRDAEGIRYYIDLAKTDVEELERTFGSGRR